MRPVLPQPLRQRAHLRLVLRAVAEEDVVGEDFYAHVVTRRCSEREPQFSNHLKEADALDLLHLTHIRDAGFVQFPSQRLDVNCESHGRI